LARLERVEARLQRHPGLFVAGNGYRGVAIGACVAEAGPLAQRILGPRG
jgi:protoporphyrinogen oxidase